MKKRLLLLSLLSTLLLSSCQRTSREVWEDTKTASRYMKRGIHSMFGKHADDYALAYYENQDKEEMEYLPLLSEDDRYLTASSEHLPPPKESPGEPGSSLPGVEGFSTPSGKLAHVFKNIHFETDTYSVKGQENLEVLEAIAQHLNKNPKTSVFIEGHADERGPASYNLALGDKRANNIRAFLAERGVDPDRLFTISYGKERPLITGHDETSWWQNRRGQFKIFER